MTPSVVSQTPVCTGEGWMMVLRGAVSQWKRSRCDSLAIGPAGGVAETYPGNGGKVLADQIGVDFRPQGHEAVAVKVNAGVEVALLQAEDDHAGIDELLPLHARHDAQDGVIKRGGRGHAWPPLRRYALWPGGA